MTMIAEGLRASPGCPSYTLITLSKEYYKIMKKTYIAPEVEITEMESQVLMFSGSLIDEEAETQLSAGRGDRRGRWGNLWDSED
jgi:hypothetical protein